MIVDILLVLAIASVITDQKIVREYIILKYINTNGYFEWKWWQRFLFDLISCRDCLSFHIGWIYSLILYGTFGWQLALLSMFSSYILQKIIK